ncbi:Ankyrin repeat-containing domain protein, partial [Elaphomyces granulatus]
QECICIAAENGNSAIVELLLANVNVDPDVKHHRYKLSPLLCACLGGHVSVVRQLLAQNNVDVNCRSILCTPLTAACRPPLEIPKLLLEQEDIDINLPDKKGRTALFWACHNNCLELVDLLLEKDNIDPNVRDIDSESFHMALRVATKNNHAPIVELLLKVKGINPNFYDGWVYPLCTAAERENSAIVKLLLAHVNTKRPECERHSPFWDPCTLGRSGPET